MIVADRYETHGEARSDACAALISSRSTILRAARATRDAGVSRWLVVRRERARFTVPAASSSLEARRGRRACRIASVPIRLGVCVVSGSRTGSARPHPRSGLGERARDRRGRRLGTVVTDMSAGYSFRSASRRRGSRAGSVGAFGFLAGGRVDCAFVKVAARGSISLSRGASGRRQAAARSGGTTGRFAGQRSPT